MTHAQAAGPLWEIYEENLDEATFLYGQWEHARVSANYVLSELLEGPEQRLHAHLEALVLGGASVAEHLLVPALTGAEPERAFAAGWALLQPEDADRCNTVFHALLRAEPGPMQTALGRAFELSWQHALPRRLHATLRKVEPPARAVLVDTLVAYRGPELLELPLRELLEWAEPVELPALLRAVAVRRQADCTGAVDRALKSSAPAIRDAAIEAGAALGLPTTQRAALSALREGAPHCRLPLAWLAVTGQPQMGPQLQSLLRESDEDRKQAAAWALGFWGTQQAVDQLCELLGDSQLAPTAAESIATITGVELEGPLLSKVPESTPPEGPLEPDAPLPVLRADEGLPVPDAGAVREWWHAHRSRFVPTARYLCGAPMTAQGLRQAADARPLWRRAGFRLGLRADLASVDLRGWARGRASG